jgi:hypothetical protein
MEQSENSNNTEKIIIKIRENINCIKEIEPPGVICWKTTDFSLDCIVKDTITKLENGLNKIIDKLEKGKIAVNPRFIIINLIITKFLDAKQYFYNKIQTNRFYTFKNKNHEETEEEREERIMGVIEGLGENLNRIDNVEEFFINELEEIEEEIQKEVENISFD